jgi:hypothetical protein
MKIELKHINELFNYTEIKEYITINKDNKIIENYKIKYVLSQKPNYQLYTETSGVITLAYDCIPSFLNFYVSNNNTLIKAISNKKEKNSDSKLPTIDIKSINSEYDCDVDEKTFDSDCDD